VPNLHINLLLTGADPLPGYDLLRLAHRRATPEVRTTQF
jgi:hypothetical protein